MTTRGKVLKPVAPIAEREWTVVGTPSVTMIPDYQADAAWLGENIDADTTVDGTVRAGTLARMRNALRLGRTVREIAFDAGRIKATDRTAPGSFNLAARAARLANVIHEHDDAELLAELENVWTNDTHATLSGKDGSLALVNDEASARGYKARKQAVRTGNSDNVLSVNMVIRTVRKLGQAVVKGFVSGKREVPGFNVWDVLAAVRAGTAGDALLAVYRPTVAAEPAEEKPADVVADVKATVDAGTGTVEAKPAKRTRKAA